MIFNKFIEDIIKFFLITVLFLGIIVWTLQAINYFDFVTEDGHGLKIYFLYTVFNFPKIIHRILPFVFFLSLFYTILNYEKKNELSIFWLNGISKVRFANKIILFSIFLMFFQIFMGSYLSPKSQFKARNYLKNSEISFFSSLIKEGKFINIVKGLTIFIKSKNNDGTYNDIFIDDTTKIQTRMIYARQGYIIDNKKNKIFKLNNGEVINIKDSKIDVFEFKQIEFNLNNLISNTIVVPKIQELSSQVLINCFFSLPFENLSSFNCDKKVQNDIVRELLKRFIKPLYIPLIALICCFTIILSKNFRDYTKINLIIFFLIFALLVISEALLRVSSREHIHFFIYLSIPIIIFIMSYIIFFKRAKYV
jgi:lipopolysaccharide export system permease protein